MWWGHSEQSWPSNLAEETGKSCPTLRTQNPILVLVGVNEC
jgi:hypothetical protein